MKYSEINEKELIEKSKDGDASAFEELLVRNGEKLFGWINSLCKRQALAEDVYQVTTIKCWQNISKFKGTSKFLTWACSISRNLAYDLWRKEKRRPTTSLEEMMEKEREGLHFQLKLSRESNDDFVSEIISKEATSKIHKKLDGLSTEHKEALFLSAEEGCSYEEIAKKQGCPVGTVMSRIFYARKEAQRRLGGIREQIKK